MKPEVSVWQTRWIQTLVAVIAVFIIINLTLLLLGKPNPINSTIDKFGMAFGVLLSLGQLYWCLTTGVCRGPGGAVAYRETAPFVYWLCVVAYFGLLAICISGLAGLSVRL